MMRFNIISFDKENSILLNNKILFEKLDYKASVKKASMKKYYFIEDSNIIEFSCFDEFSKYDILKEMTNKNKENRTIFLLSTFNEENIKIIKEASKYNKKNIVIIDNKDTFEKARGIYIINNWCKVIYLPQLKNSNDVEVIIDLLYKFINILFGFKRNEARYNSIKESIFMFGYVEKENITKDIVVIILENFQLIQYKGNFHLNIYNSNMNLQELSYIEDPLKEYMDYNSNLIIKQLTNKTLNDRVCFSLTYIK